MFIVSIKVTRVKRKGNNLMLKKILLTLTIFTFLLNNTMDNQQTGLVPYYLTSLPPEIEYIIVNLCLESEKEEFIERTKKSTDDRPEYAYKLIFERFSVKTLAIQRTEQKKTYTKAIIIVDKDGSTLSELTAPCKYLVSSECGTMFAQTVARWPGSIKTRKNLQDSEKVLIIKNLRTHAVEEHVMPKNLSCITNIAFNVLGNQIIVHYLDRQAADFAQYAQHAPFWNKAAPHHLIFPVTMTKTQKIITLHDLLNQKRVCKKIAQLQNSVLTNCDHSTN